MGWGGVRQRNQKGTGARTVVVVVVKGKRETNAQGEGKERKKNRSKVGKMPSKRGGKKRGDLVHLWREGEVCGVCEGSSWDARVWWGLWGLVGDGGDGDGGGGNKKDEQGKRGGRGFAFI